jgi:hypothetical protein
MMPARTKIQFSERGDTDDPARIAFSGVYHRPRSRGQDQVASSPASYVSYLNSVSQLLAADISPELLHSETDVERIIGELQGERARATIRNYASAMRQYVAMVLEAGLWQDKKR